MSKPKHGGRWPFPEIERFLDKVDKTKTCWLWTGSVVQPGGYGRFSHRGGDHVYAHRWSFVHFKEILIPHGMMVLHNCDNPICVKPDHLFLGTAQDNMDDKVKKGRLVSSPGERNGMAKLTAEVVAEIRAMYATGNYLQRDIADGFGISNRTVSKIVLSQRWK